MTKLSPKTYTAPHAVYVNSRLYATGEPFVTADEPGEQWEEVKPAEVAAIHAADKTSTVQASLEDMDVNDLRALAATKNVETTVDGKKLGKADLITAIKAATDTVL